MDRCFKFFVAVGFSFNNHYNYMTEYFIRTNFAEIEFLAFTFNKKY